MHTQGEIDVLVGYMPHIVRSGGVSAWERKFAASIIARTRKGAFRPSAKQLAHMRRIVRGFQERTLREDDVVEGAGVQQ